MFICYLIFYTFATNLYEIAGILNEYLDKRMGISDLRIELERLVKEYNRITGRYLFVFATDFSKGRAGVDIELQQDDFYNIQDILRESPQSEIDFYIETPGGSGTAAEEIARFLHKKFNKVTFVIAGEAKSAGTILVMSGDEIMMTDTGSLGPIDAQVRIGRYMSSAHDYKAWVEQKRMEAMTAGRLNPFDAMMVAQISPGELYGVINSLEFAKDLVKKWLVDYKFKNWTVTSSGQPVDEEKKKSRAAEIAEFLSDHMSWRSHGRSLKIEDLNEYLKIERIDDNIELADVVYRIKTVLRLIFSDSSIYKIYRTEDTYLAKTAIMANSQSMIPLNNSAVPKVGQIQAAEFNISCPKCRKLHKVVGYIGIDSAGIAKMKLPVNPNVMDNDILKCDNCQFEIDLKPIKNQFEVTHRKKLSFK